MRALTISPAGLCPAMARPNACCAPTWRGRSPACEADLARQQLGLKVYDCYRPARAVAAFARWSHDGADDGATKRFYPALDKRALFNGGYIAAHSAHSAGNAVDLTLRVRDVAPDARLGAAPSTRRTANYGALHGAARPTRARQCARHGHRLRLLRRHEPHRKLGDRAGAETPARPPRCRHAGPRASQLFPRMVALQFRRARADLRFSDRAASLVRQQALPALGGDFDHPHQQLRRPGRRRAKPAARPWRARRDSG